MIYVAVISQVWLMQRRRASPPGGARSEVRAAAAAKNSKIDLCPPNFNAIQISASLARLLLQQHSIHILQRGEIFKSKLPYLLEKF